MTDSAFYDTDLPEHPGMLCVGMVRMANQVLHGLARDPELSAEALADLIGLVTRSLHFTLIPAGGVNASAISAKDGHDGAGSVPPRAPEPSRSCAAGGPTRKSQPYTAGGGEPELIVPTMAGRQGRAVNPEPSTGAAFDHAGDVWLRDSTGWSQAVLSPPPVFRNLTWAELDGDHGPMRPLHREVLTEAANTLAILHGSVFVHG